MRALLPGLALCLAGCPPVLDDVAPQPRPEFIFKHAHNDYEHPRPLLDALEQGFESVEADVWLDGEAIGVSHTGAPFKGTLDALYLQPLAERVAQRGSVHGDGRPFTLWLDLKQGSPALQDLLVGALAARDYLTTFDDDGVLQQRAVTVLLTGHDAAKKAMVARASPRPYARDSNDYRPDDAPADGRWRAYALNTPAFLSWSGLGELPPAQRRQLENLVHGAHAKGRQLRLYANPDTEAYWQAAREAGVDFVNTDDLRGLAEAFAE